MPQAPYLDCHRPDLLPEVISPGQQLLFDQGHGVGALARRRYPGGVLIEYDRSPYAEATTARAMANPSVPAIFEPAFAYAGVRVRVDILVQLPASGVVAFGKRLGFPSKTVDETVDDPDEKFGKGYATLRD